MSARLWLSALTRYPWSVSAWRHNSLWGAFAAQSGKAGARHCAVSGIGGGRSGNPLAEMPARPVKIMSQWTHSICYSCYDIKNPGRTPVAIREEFRDEKPETCCFCGAKHGSGIYMRHDGSELKCKGKCEN